MGKLARFIHYYTDPGDHGGGDIPDPLNTFVGSIVRFMSKAAKPLVKIEATLEPIQSGSGDPSPENIRPISGHTGVDIWDDPKHGGTINWNQLAKLDATYWTSIRSDISFTGQSLKLEANSNSTTATKYAYFNITAGHKYAVFGTNNASTNTTFHFGVYKSMSPNTYDQRVAVSSAAAGEPIGAILTSDTAAVFGISLPTSAKAEDGKFAQIDNLCVCDMTAMFGAGNEPETIEAFKSLFLKNYYAYNSGTETCVSAVNGDPYEHVTISFGQTVYGGELTVNEDGSGKIESDRVYAVLDGSESAWAKRTQGTPYFALKVGDIGTVTDRAIICDSYASVTLSTGNQNIGADVFNSSTYNGAFVGLRPIDYTLTLADFKTMLSNNNVSVCYKLATPITIPLTPGQVEALQGNNTVWVDGATGDITVQAYGTEIV